MDEIDLWSVVSNMIGTDRDKELRGLLYDLFNQDKLIGYGIAYLVELRGRINERVIDDVFACTGLLRRIAGRLARCMHHVRVQRRTDLGECLAQLHERISARRSSNTLMTAS